MSQAPKLRELADERLPPDRFRVERDQALLPHRPRSGPRVDDRRVLNGNLAGAPLWGFRAAPGPAGTLWALQDLLQPLQRPSIRSERNFARARRRRYSLRQGVATCWRRRQPAQVDESSARMHPNQISSNSRASPLEPAVLWVP